MVRATTTAGITKGPATCLQYWLLLRDVTSTGAVAMPELTRHIDACPLCQRWVMTETREP